MNEIRCLGRDPQAADAKERAGCACPEELGDLPSCGSLATPYVPAQNTNAETYPRGKALEQGSLYAPLDLPFHLKVNAADLPDTPLNRLRALDFAVHELGLYLDTHPYDREALETFRTLSREGKSLRETYIRENGPLTMAEADGANGYGWWKAPWPWQYTEEEA